MDLSTQTHLKTLRALLEFRLRDLRADVHAAELARQSGVQDGSPHEVGDRKDEASRHQVDDIGAAQERRNRDEMASVEAALHRLDNGTYGDCVECAEPIPLARLLAQPAASCCAGCQEGREHRREPGVLRA